MKRRVHIGTWVLLGINLYLALLLSKYNWSPRLIEAIGGMSGDMPTTQVLAQFPPFNLLQNSHAYDSILVKPITGTTLIILRSIYASFLHFSWAHALSNMLVLFIIGRRFEDTNYFGTLMMTYLITGIVSMTSAYVIQPNALTAGASGAIFGIMGAMFVEGLRSKKAYNDKKIQYSAYNAYQENYQYIFALLVVNILSTFTTPGISIVGHVGGLITGLIIGLILPLRKTA